MKEIFLERVRDRLYERLRAGAMKSWDVSDVINFSAAVIRENKEQIDTYLSQKKVTLSNINKSVDDLVDTVLIPSIEVK